MMAIIPRLIMLLLLIACNFIATSMGETVNLCPPIEVIDPCGCVSDGKGIRLECIRVKDISSIRRAVLSLTSTKATDIFIDFLFLKHERIPSDLFSGIPVKGISFVNCELGNIGDEGKPAFLGLENTLEELTVTFSFPEEKGLKLLNLSNLRSLEYLQIEGNEVEELSNDWFSEGPKSLRNVIFMTNSIRVLGSRAFSSLINVKDLWITGNKFSSLSRTMLPMPALHLVSLDLTNNKIVHLPEDIFSSMPSLKEVILDENEIQHLPESTWSPIWRQLTRLYLKSNPLNCDKGIKWLLGIRRPHVVKGKCAEPPSESGKELKQLIDENVIEDDLDY